MCSSRVHGRSLRPSDLRVHVYSRWCLTTGFSASNSNVSDVLKGKAQLDSETVGQLYLGIAVSTAARQSPPPCSAMKVENPGRSSRGREGVDDN